MDDQKYAIMENVLNKINQKFISLPKEETKIHNIIMKSVTDQIIKKLRNDEFFNSMFDKIYFGGSYYDNLKVGKAEEYDLDIVLNLPSTLGTVVNVSDKHGFVHVKPTKLQALVNEKEMDRYLTFNSWIEKDYFSTVKLFSWMQGLYNRTINGLPKVEDKTVLDVEITKEKTIKAFVTVSIKSPALTLFLTTNYNDVDIKIDIDLVPCFQFKETSWPKGNYRENMSKKYRNFLVVPKKPRGVDEKTVEQYWRLSFQEQERELINGCDKMKPAIRLIKKWRDVQDHAKIASYFIKTVFLWEYLEQDKDFWNKPLSVVFMTMLKKYSNMVTSGNIPYFWNENFNLIEQLKKPTYESMGNSIKRAIGDIERNLTSDPFVVAKYLMPTKELCKLKTEVDLGKKHLNKIRGSPPRNNESMESSLIDLDEPLSLNLETVPGGMQNADTPILYRLGAVEARFGNLERKLEDQSGVMNMLNGIQNAETQILNRLGAMERRFSDLERKLDDRNLVVTMLNGIQKQILNRLSAMEAGFSNLGRKRDETSGTEMTENSWDILSFDRLSINLQPELRN